MSQEANRVPDIERGDDTVSSHAEQIPVAPNESRQPSQRKPSDGNTSKPLFSMYSKKTKDLDDKLTRYIQEDAKGVLIFTGLFSAALSALLAVSIQDLRPSSQDTSAFYLENIFTLLAEPNATHTSIPSTIPKPPPFSPPRYAIWVNSLWCLSLVISLTCALLATLIHRWGRDYIVITQFPTFNPEMQARIRAFLAIGLSNSHMFSVLSASLALLHLSLFLFLVGFLIFLFNVNRIVFDSVIWWVVLFLVVYACATLSPILRENSPYSTPLSESVWFLYVGLSSIILRFLSMGTVRDIFSIETRRHFLDLSKQYHRWFLGTMLDPINEAVSQQASQMDLDIFAWMTYNLYDDDALETFFEGIPNFYPSNLEISNKDLLAVYRERFQELSEGFLGRTLPNSIFESVKIRRFTICMNATNVVCGPDGVSNILDGILSERLGRVPQSIQMAQTLTSWCTNNDRDISEPARCLVANILAIVRERDDRWIALAVDQFGLPELVLRESITHADDSVLLSILIDLSRRALRSSSWTPRILRSFSNFDIHNTLPGLQHEFCTLWNEIASEATNERESGNIEILDVMRPLFIALHRGTDAIPTRFPGPIGDDDDVLSWSWLYRSCNITSHHPDPAGHASLNYYLRVPYRPPSRQTRHALSTCVDPNW